MKTRVPRVGARTKVFIRKTHKEFSLNIAIARVLYCIVLIFCALHDLSLGRFVLTAIGIIRNPRVGSGARTLARVHYSKGTETKTYP